MLFFFFFLDKFKSFIEYLINEVNSLQYADEPNYLTIHSKINEALKGCGYANEENFSALTNTVRIIRIFYSVKIIININHILDSKW